MKASKSNGFTLIEMSIVLVVIGLIIGGILIGQDLIEAATIRSEVRQLEVYSSAVNTYRLKYNQLPGDDPNAAALGLGPAGNGDGIIQLSHGSTPYEGINAWTHLANAGLVPGSYAPNDCIPGTNYPLTTIYAFSSFINAPSGYVLFTADYTGFDINGIVKLQYLGDGKVWIALMSGSSGNCQGLARGGIASSLLQLLDIKIDDGIPFTGRVRLMGQDGVSTDNSLQSMCNDSLAGLYGENCNYLNSNGWCATGAVGSSGVYTNFTTTVCPYAYGL